MSLGGADSSVLLMDSGLLGAILEGAEGVALEAGGEQERKQLQAQEREEPSARRGVRCLFSMSVSLFQFCR